MNKDSFLYSKFSLFELHLFSWHVKKLSIYQSIWKRIFWKCFSLDIHYIISINPCDVIYYSIRNTFKPLQSLIFWCEWVREFHVSVFTMGVVKQYSLKFHYFRFYDQVTNSCNEYMATPFSFPIKLVNNWDLFLFKLVIVL